MNYVLPVADDGRDSDAVVLDVDDRSGGIEADDNLGAEDREVLEFLPEGHDAAAASLPGSAPPASNRPRSVVT